MHLTTYQRPDFKPLLNICRGLGGAWSAGKPVDWPNKSAVDSWQPDADAAAPLSPPTNSDAALSTRKEDATGVESSQLLELPSDAILLIYDQLDSPEALSLSLTCKSLYRLCFSKYYTGTLPQEDRKRFLLLLEKDPRLGRGVFYCYPCNSLHKFEQHWGPHSNLRSGGEDGVAQGEQGGEEQGSSSSRQDCDNKDRFSPIGNRFNLSYTLARLVMNSHLYGPSHGIPLRNICVSHTAERDVLRIRCTTDARIRDGELLLLRTYAFSVARGSVDEFRRCTGARDFRLCQHMPLLSGSSAYRQHIAELQRRPPPRQAGEESAGSGLVPCEDSQGSCGICLMDYDITIAEAWGDGNRDGDGNGDNGAAAAWDVSIRAYHQLGACRSPDDWKWARFTEAVRPHLFFPNRPNRRGSTLGARAVKERWFGLDQGEGDGRVAPPKKMTATATSQNDLSLALPSCLWRGASPLAEAPA
ncbi:hypothetical protein PLIIFM63780_004484 [Purpureocillium lilacinum]|nr:hypothetical protein PLIIFM63780_004484 [Purpureocillium lilacinum]